MVKLPPLETPRESPASNAKGKVVDHLAALAAPDHPLRAPAKAKAKQRKPRKKSRGKSSDAAASDDAKSSAEEGISASRPSVKRKSKNRSQATRGLTKNGTKSAKDVLSATVLEMKFFDDPLFRGHSPEEVQSIKTALSEAAANRLAVNRKAMDEQRARTRLARDQRLLKMQQVIETSEDPEKQVAVYPRPISIFRRRVSIADGSTHRRQVSGDGGGIERLVSNRSEGSRRQTPTSPRSVVNSVKSQYDNTNDVREDRRGSVNVLGALKLKSDRKSRMVNLTKCHKMNLKERMLGKHQDLRERQVDALREDDKKLLRTVFERGTYDCRQLLLRLRELGIKGHSDLDNTALQNICEKFENNAHNTDDRKIDFYEFAGILVPGARTRMQDRQRAALAEQFEQADKFNSGAVTDMACLRIANDMFVSHVSGEDLDALRADVKDMFDELHDPETRKIDFKNFCHIFWHLREKYDRDCAERERLIIETYGVDADEAEIIREELLALYYMLRSHQDDQGKMHLDKVDIRGIIGLLCDSGLLPSQPSQRKEMEHMLQEASLKGDLSFPQLKELIQGFRSMGADSYKEVLQRLFMKYDSDRSGALSLVEAVAVFADLGVVPKTKADQEELKRMLDAADGDGSGEIDVDEFQYLVQRVTEKLRSMQRHRENETARSLDFSPKEVSELREAFFALDKDGSGGLDLDELRQTLVILRRPFSAPDLNELFELIDRNYDGCVDFQEFLYFVKSTSLPDGEWRKFLQDEFLVVKDD